MCVIIHKPADKTVPLAHIREAMLCNRDGWGVAWIEDGEVHTRWGFEMNRAVEIVEENMDKEMVFHARVGTSGNVNIVNCHPFKITDDVYLAHNGVFYDLSDRFSKYCDSWHLADQLRPFFERYTDAILKTDFFQGWCKLLCQRSNKLAFISANHGVLIINREAGVEMDGVWYSNTSAFPRPASTNVKRGWQLSQDEEEQLILGMEYVREKKRRKNSKKGTAIVGALPPAADDEQAIANITAGEDRFKKMADAGTLNTHAFPPSEE